MTARPSAVDSAVMHDHHSTVEGLADGIGRFDVGLHVLIARLRAPKGTIKGVKDHGHGPLLAELAPDDVDQRQVITDEIKALGLRVEWDVSFCSARKRSRKASTRVSIPLSLESRVDHWPLVNAPAPVGPAQRDVHDEVECPKALARLGRAPDHGEADVRNQPLDER